MKAKEKELILKVIHLLSTDKIGRTDKVGKSDWLEGMGILWELIDSDIEEEKDNKVIKAKSNPCVVHVSGHQRELRFKFAYEGVYEGKALSPDPLIMSWMKSQENAIKENSSDMCFLAPLVLYVDRIPNIYDYTGPVPSMNVNKISIKEMLPLDVKRGDVLLDASNGDKLLLSKSIISRVVSVGTTITEFEIVAREAKDSWYG